MPIQMSTPTHPELTDAAAEQQDPGGRMSFFEHLADLRTRLFHACGAIAIGAVVGVSVAKYVMNFFARPMTNALAQNGLPPKMYVTHPVGYINTYFSIGLYFGIVIAMPYVLYQVWLFIAPGLYRHERKAVAGFVMSAFLLFLGGLAFSYYVMLPYLLKFLVQFTTGDQFTPWMSQDEYFPFLFKVLFGVGVVFELPVVVFLLALFNIVTPQFLWKHFRYAILIITIIAAIITPTPDAMTMLVFMAPMLILYLAGIAVAWVVVRKKKRAAAFGK
jgi:sec-independent protein translocase protein TatC